MSKLIPKLGKKPVPKEQISEEEAKKELGIRSFGEMPMEKMPQLMSMLPFMNPETATAVIAQFPNFVDFGKEMVSNYSQTCSEILQNAKEGESSSIRAYQSILDSLRERMEAETITESERSSITADMVAVADKINEAHLQNMKFLDRIDKRRGLLYLGLGVLGAAILGVTFYNIDLSDM